MNLTESKFLASTTRGALIDLLESEIIDVEDKIGTVNFIRETSDSKILELAQFAMSDGNISREFSIQYKNYLKTKNDSLPIINEKEYNDRLFSYLSEDGDATTVVSTGGLTDQEKAKLIKWGIPVAAAYLYFNNPTRFISGLSKLSKFKKHEALRIYSFFERVKARRAGVEPPTAKEIVTKFTKATAQNKITFSNAAEHIAAHPVVAAKMGATAVKDALSKKFPNIKRNTGIFAGAVALAIGAQQIYQRFFTQAAKACNKLSGKDKTICILKFKVSAAHKAMEQLNAQKGKCPQSKDPEKCVYYVNRELWQWQKKMKAYQTKLVSMGHQEEAKKSDTKKHPFD